jgi:hypothetical protein
MEAHIGEANTLSSERAKETWEKQFPKSVVQVFRFLSK